MVLNVVKFGQTGPSRAKHMPKRVKQDQTRLKRLKWGVAGVSRGKLGVKLG